MINRLRGFYGEYPGQFWTLIGASFIDQLGGRLLFPFFALYVTAHFGVGMTIVGYLFTIFATGNLLGGLVGGAMTDKLGRRWMLIFGLIFSALSSLFMGLVDNLTSFYILAGVVGFLGSAGGPAAQAMIADLLPEEKVAEGYGLQRVSINVAAAVGPAVGGILASQSFLLLFIIDAITSVITAIIVYFNLPETKPEIAEDQSEESLVDTFRGYIQISKDRYFLAFVFVFMLTVVVYSQMDSTLSVYLRDVHGISLEQFGLLLSLNAAMVVLFQFWITRRISNLDPMAMLSLGAIFYAVGFVMFGPFTTTGMFVLAMVILTIGEMIVAPLGRTVVAQLAPERMRGRYMAIFGFSWMLPYALGPLAGGIIIDNFNPRLVWYVAGILALMAVLGFLRLRRKKTWSVGNCAQILTEQGAEIHTNLPAGTRRSQKPAEVE